MYTREEILNEMRKLGKEKEGKAPSEDELRQNAKIKDYHWHKYWPKITDLQKEAGFLPNKFLKTPHKHSALCEKFIALIRELRKWPTKAEIEVKHNKEKRFPGSSIFYRNLGKGNVKGLALTLLEFTKDKQGFDDIVNICGSVIKESDNKARLVENNIGDEKHGWVYMFKLGRYYKVGRSNDTGRRYRELSVQFPDELEHRHKIETDDPSGVEAYWHNRFKSKHVKGDFFNLDSSDVKAFKRWRQIF